MADDALLFDQLSSGFAPFASGRTFNRRTGLEGIPLFDQGVGGVAAQMFLGPQLQQLMGQYGMTPMGLAHDQNVYDVMRTMNLQRSMDSVMQQAMSLEQAGHMQTFRGIAGMTGMPWGTKQRRAAQAFSETMSGIAPVLAEVAPEFLDDLAGPRGSAVAFARQMHLGSRYRVDPVSGRMGMDEGSTTALTNVMMQDLFSPTRASGMQGFGAGQIGALYDDMTRRGMVESMRPAMMAGRNLAGLNPQDMDKLTLDPNMASAARGFDAESVKRSISQYVQVVAAVRDIFGDIGRPNAPMRELMKGLETLTQGGVGQLDAGRLSGMVRTTHELGRMAGVSLDATMALQQHAAGRAEMLGLNPLQAINATQGSLAWGAAFRGTGGAAVPAWDRFNADQMQQLDVNLRVQAAGSAQANQLGLLMRLSDRGGGFEAGSTAAAMAAAVRNEQTEFVDPATGQVRSTRMRESEFAGMLTASRGSGGQPLGLTEGRVGQMLGQRRVNEEFVEKYDIANRVRAMQPGEVREWTQNRVRESLIQTLQAGGLSREDAEKSAGMASQRLTERMFDMTQTEFADSNKRTGMMAETIRDSLQGSGAGATLRANGADEAFYRTAAEGAYGYVDESVRRGGLRGNRSLQNVQAVNNPYTLQQAEQNRTQARFAAGTAEALSPLGRGSILRRSVEYLQREGDKADFGKFLATALGGVNLDDIETKLTPGVQRIAETIKGLEADEARYLRMPAGPDRDTLLQSITGRKTALTEEVKKLTEVGGQIGIFSGDSMLRPEDVDAAMRSSDKVSGQMRDLTALRGGFAGYVDAKTLVAAQKGGLMQSEGAIAREIMSRRGLKDTGADAVANFVTGAKLTPEEARVAVIMRRSDESRYENEKDPDRRRALMWGLNPDANLDESVRRRIEAASTVTDSDIANEIASDPSLKGQPPDRIRQLITQKRMNGNTQLWNQFWASPSGKQFKDETQDYMDRVDDVSTRMIMSPETLRRLGPQAMTMYKGLRGNMDKLQALADKHTGGDKAKLLGGNVDPKVAAEARALFDQTSSTMKSYQDTVGKGQQWGDSNAAAAALGTTADTIDDIKLLKQSTIDKIANLHGRTDPGSAEKMKELSMQTGMSAGQLSEVGNAIDRLDKMAAGQRALETSPNSVLLKELFTSVGATDEQARSEAEALAPKMVTAADKQKIQRMLGAERTLQGFAKGDTVNAMVSKFTSAKDKGAFFTEYGISSPEDQSAFELAVGQHRRFGLDKSTDPAQLIKQVQGQLTSPAGQMGSPQEFHLTSGELKLDVKNGTASVDAHGTTYGNQ